MPDGASQRASVTPRLFVDEYARTNERVAQALREYLGDPGEKNTRALRAAVRRLTTMLRVVPKGSRKRPMKQALDCCRKVLKLTSKIRDVDIIEGKLSAIPHDQTVELLMANLEEEREAFVGDSMKAAWRLFEERKSEPQRKDFRGARRWVRRALLDLDDNVAAELPLVLKNEGKIDELHSLRKHAKTFRYVLELTPQTRSSTRASEVLRSWQDVLGEIRDSDIMIEYLGRARQRRRVKEALASERALRHRRYRAFVRSCARDMKTGPSLMRLAGIRREPSG